MTLDTDVRYAIKRGSGWEGYQVHLSETCDDTIATGRAHLVTNVATTDATITEVEMPEQVHTRLDRRNLLPGEHLVDAGYSSAELMVGSQRDVGVNPAGPTARRPFGADSVQACPVRPQRTRSTQTGRQIDAVPLTFTRSSNRPMPTKP